MFANVIQAEFERVLEFNMPSGCRFDAFSIRVKHDVLGDLVKAYVELTDPLDQVRLVNTTFWDAFSVTIECTYKGHPLKVTGLGVVGTIENVTKAIDTFEEFIVRESEENE